MESCLLIEVPKLILPLYFRHQTQMVEINYYTLKQNYNHK